MEDNTFSLSQGGSGHTRWGHLAPALVMGIGPLLMFLLFTVVSLASLAFVVRAKDEAGLVHADRLVAIHEARRHVLRHHIEARAFLVDLDPAHLVRRDAARREALSGIDAIEASLAAPEARAFVARIRSLEAAHHERVTSVIALRRREGADSEFVRRTFREVIAPSAEHLEAVFEAFARYQSGVLSEARAGAHDAGRFTRGLLLALAAASIASLLVATALLVRWYRRDAARALIDVDKVGRFADIINHLDHSIVFFADAAPLRFHFVSERVQKLLGVSANASLSNPESFFDLVYPADRAVLRDTLARVVDQVQDQRCEHRMVSQEGLVRWFQTGVHPTRDPDGTLRLYGVMMEITNLKRAQEEELRTRAQLEAMVDAAPSIIFVKDLSGAYLLVNRRFEDLFGLRRDSVVGKDDFALFPPEFAREFVANDERVKETRGAVTVEEAARLTDGERTFASVKFPLFGAGGELFAVGGISTDITDSKRAGEALRESEERHRLLAGRLQAALLARDEVLAFVSHDLRNPLNVILMGAALLETPSGVAPAEVARRIRRSGGRMDRMIGDILDSARAESGTHGASRREKVGPELVAEVIEEMSPLASAKRVRLLSRKPEGGYEFTCDKDLVFRVLTNLVDNGLKFTPAGGTVEIEVGTGPGEVLFTVRDSGKGLSPAALPKVFDRFWQERQGAERRGLGLGLSIARGIVEAHGGRMWVESEEGRGAVFRFTLPKRPAGASAHEGRPSGAKDDRASDVWFPGVPPA